MLISTISPNELLQVSTKKHSIMKEYNAYEKAGAIRANLINKKINDLNREKNNCTSNQEKIQTWPFKCKYCFANFKCPEDLLNHIRVSHEKKDVKKDSNIEIEVNKKAFTSLECSICNVCFLSKFHLNSHTSTVHRGEYRHHCSHCNDYFYNEYNLKYHISNVHERKKSIQEDKIGVQGPASIKENRSSLLFKCDLCHLSFEQEKDLNVHIWVHPVKNKQFETINNNSLKDIKTSSNKIEKTSVSKTANTIHFGKKSSLHTCSICNQCFSNPSLLAKHEMTVHEGKKLYCLQVTNIP